MAAGFVATGPDDESVARSRESIRRQLGFLFSTPAYWPAVEHAGYSDLGPTLGALVEQGRWNDLEDRIPEGLIDRLVPCGRYDEITDILSDRYAAIVSHTTFPIPEDPARDTEVAELITILRNT